MVNVTSMYLVIPTNAIMMGGIVDIDTLTKVIVKIFMHIRFVHENIIFYKLHTFNNHLYRTVTTASSYSHANRPPCIAFPSPLHLWNNVCGVCLSMASTYAHNRQYIFDNLLHLSLNSRCHQHILRND